MHLAPPPPTVPASLPAAPYLAGRADTAAAPCTITTTTSQTCTYDMRLPQPVPFPQPMVGQFAQPYQQQQQPSVAQSQQVHPQQHQQHFTMSAQQQQPVVPIPMPQVQPQQYSAAAYPHQAHPSHAMPPAMQWSANPRIDLTSDADAIEPKPQPQQPHPTDVVHPQQRQLEERMLTAQQMAYYSRYDSVLE